MIGPSSVGTLWSIVAMERSGRRSVRPASRRPSKACGEVTSWIEMEVDEEQRGLAGRLGDDVALPDLVEKGLGHRVLPLCRTVGSRPMLKITVGGFELEARLEEEARAQDDRGPARRCSRSRAGSCRPAGAARRPGCRWASSSTSSLGPENANSYPAAGELLLYPGGLSEVEILFPYGATCFASKMGQLAGNHFATVQAGQEHLAELGRRVLWEGAQDIRFDEV